jgi:hypothetical protein
VSSLQISSGCGLIQKEVPKGENEEGNMEKHLMHVISGTHWCTAFAFRSIREPVRRFAPDSWTMKVRWLAET